MWGRRRSTQGRQSIFAGVVMGFAAAVERLRTRNRGNDVDYTEKEVYFDIDEDGGLASARVPRRPPDRSGSGSAALIEPADDNLPVDMRER